MMNTSSAKTPAGFDGFEFLTMAQARRGERTAVLRKLDEHGRAADRTRAS